MIVLRDKLLFSIVPHGDGDYFARIARESGASGGTLFMAKGTASNSFLKALGLGTNYKDIVVINSEEKILNSIVEKSILDKKISGVSAILGSDNMSSQFDLITIIVNTGYSDDIMHAARKAGATGGTVTNARGTAIDTDKFLGITIVPEKEMIFILTEKTNTQKIVDTISNLPCLNEKGMGVMYVQSVEKFINLEK